MTITDGARTADRALTAPVEIDDVSVHFGGIKALDGVSFSVQPQRICAVIGPNGAGKSTLFNVVSGFYRATGGAVRLGEHTLSTMRPHHIARLGVARTFQNLELSESETVLENILLGCHQIGRTNVLRAGVRWPLARREEREARERCGEVAEVVGLSHLLHTTCEAMPYGVRKRIEIARALASRPRLLLLDEPVAGMTAGESQEMADVIRQAHERLDLTILLIEHDVEFTMGLADHVVVLDFGRVIAAGAPTAVRNDDAVIRAYLGGATDETPATEEQDATTGATA